MLKTSLQKYNNQQIRYLTYTVVNLNDTYKIKADIACDFNMSLIHIFGIIMAGRVQDILCICEVIQYFEI